MNTLFLLAVCAAPPPQSTLPIHVPCEVRPAEPVPAKKPSAQIEEIDTPAGQTPKGVKDDRQMAAMPTWKTKEDAWKALAMAAIKAGRAQEQELLIDGRWQKFMATPDGQVSRWVDGPPPSPQQSARSVPTQQPFRGQWHPECEFSPSHVCAKCGQVQLDIAHFNADGTHTHTCANCGHSWRH